MIRKPVYLPIRIPHIIFPGPWEGGLKRPSLLQVRIFNVGTCMQPCSSSCSLQPGHKEEFFFMVKIPSLALIGMLMLPFSAPAVASEPTSLEPVVVTATKLETPVSEIASSVTVITAEEIENSTFAGTHKK
jgi:hypothetical protein